MVLLVVLGMVAAGLGWFAAHVALSRSQEPPDVAGLLWPDPKPLTPFSLRDQRGQRFDLARLEGQWTLMFFGYTHCPDVCPATLSALTLVERWLLARGASTSNIQYAFISVDPERDTPRRLGEYLAQFDERLIGATGSHAALGGLTRQLGVVYGRGAQDAEDDYRVDHTSSLLLTDPRARLIAAFRAPHDAGSIAERLAAIRAFVDS